MPVHVNACICLLEKKLNSNAKMSWPDLTLVYWLRQASQFLFESAQLAYDWHVYDQSITSLLRKFKIWLYELGLRH